MRRFLIIVVLFAVSLTAFAQNTPKFTFSVSASHTTIHSIRFRLDQIPFLIRKNEVIIPINSDLEGEVKYYDSYDGRDKAGKLKSVGNVKFNYYDVYEGVAKAGKLKSVGDFKVTYYDIYDGEDRNGKLNP